MCVVTCNGGCSLGVYVYVYRITPSQNISRTYAVAYAKFTRCAEFEQLTDPASNHLFRTQFTQNENRVSK